MSLWAVGLVVLLTALLLPLVMVLLDSPLFRRPRRADPRLPVASVMTSDRDRAADDLTNRVFALEDEVDDLSRAVRDLRDDVQVLQHAVEQREARPPTRHPDRPD